MGLAEKSNVQKLHKFKLRESPFCKTPDNYAHDGGCEVVLSQAEFDELIADPDKSIEGDIIWQQERSTWFGFRTEITSPAGYPLFLKGSYNPIIAALSYVIIHRSEGRIYGLDMGKDHRALLILGRVWRVSY